MTNIELRDSIAKELFVQWVKDEPTINPSMIATSAFATANDFMEAKAKADSHLIPGRDFMGQASGKQA